MHLLAFVLAARLGGLADAKPLATAVEASRPWAATGGIVEGAGAPASGTSLASTVHADADFPVWLRGSKKLLSTLEFTVMGIDFFTIGIYLDGRSALWSKATDWEEMSKGALGEASLRYRINSGLLTRWAWSTQVVRDQFAPHLAFWNCSDGLLREHMDLALNGPNFKAGSMLEFPLMPDGVRYFFDGHYQGAAGDKCSATATMGAWIDPLAPVPSFAEAVLLSVEAGVDAEPPEKVVAGCGAPAILVWFLWGLAALLLLLLCTLVWCCRRCLYRVLAAKSSEGGG